MDNERSSYMVVMTIGVQEKMKRSALYSQFALSSLKSFLVGDFGCISENDRKQNEGEWETAMGNYKDPDGGMLWIKRDPIDENWNKFAVTLLLPSEW